MDELFEFVFLSPRYSDEIFRNLFQMERQERAALIHKHNLQQASSSSSSPLTASNTGGGGQGSAYPGYNGGAYPNGYNPNYPTPAAGGVQDPNAPSAAAVPEGTDPSVLPASNPTDDTGFPPLHITGDPLLEDFPFGTTSGGGCASNSSSGSGSCSFNSFRHPQSEVKERMRAILVDWLVEVHAKFRLMEETLYLTVDLLDRYLQTAPVRRVKLQQVGVTCLFIASK